MHRFFFLFLGGLELAAAIVLLVIAFQLPGQRDVDEMSSRVQEVSRNAGRQVRNLRRQVALVRARQPELLALAVKLEKQMRGVSDSVSDQQLNGETLSSVSEALGNVAGGLDALATMLDPKGIEQIGKGLGTTADYLDRKILPTADKAAAALEDAGKTLRGDVKKLKVLLEESPVELKAARAMVDSLTKFEDGLKRMKKVILMDNFEAMREGFKGLETSLDSGADQVEKVASYTIPKVTVKGLRLMVEEKDFWPEGKTIAEGMRKGAKGCEAAGKEMDALKKELPRLRESLDQSRKVVSSTREALQSALAGQEKLEPVLKSLPRNLGRLAGELPALTAELAKVLRETARLKEVAAALRQAEKGMSTASAKWPQLRESLGKSATLLRTTREHLQDAIANQDDFETTMRQTVELTTLFARALPVLLEQMEEGLSQQESSLGELGDSIDRVSEVVPAASRSASRLLLLTRLLLGLVALTVGLHAGYLLLGGGKVTRLPDRAPGHGDKAGC
jgi:DNA repair exonuclease SbcCD ATPase subunit